MNNEHPITPSQELVDKWVAMLEYCEDIDVFSDIARWGADQELEACLQWFSAFYCMETWMQKDLEKFRTARRPKPPSLKEQALKELEWVDENLNMPLLNQCDAIHTIRLALESLPE